MKTDLNNAKTLLEALNCTCVLCAGAQFHSSHHRGVKPLLDFLDSGSDFRGFCAADRVVGKATAFLYLLLGVTAVHAQVMSKAAERVFLREGIAYSYDRLVDAIQNRDHTGPCPMEYATRDTEDPHLALAAIRQALQQLRQTP